MCKCKNTIQIELSRLPSRAGTPSQQLPKIESSFSTLREQNFAISVPSKHRNQGLFTQNEIRRIREELEEQEKLEAEWAQYGRKVTPGSRSGSGGRMPHKTPPWMMTASLRTAIPSLKNFALSHPENMDKLRATLLRSAAGLMRDDREEKSPYNFCRKVALQLVKKSPMLKGWIEEIDKEEEKSSVLSLSHRHEAEGVIGHMLDEAGTDVVIGNGIKVKWEDLSGSIDGVRTLSLSENGMGDDGAASMGELMRQNDTLVRLRLHHNQIHDDGMVRLAECLLDNTALTSLKLDFNLLTDLGATAVAEYLAPCKCLTVSKVAIAERQELVMEALIKHGFPVNPSFIEERPMLLDAAAVGSEELVQMALEQGAEIESTDEEGKTAFLLAAQNGSVAVLRVLKAAGANSMVTDKDGRTALMLSARAGHEDCVQYLMQQAAALTKRITVSLDQLKDVKPVGFYKGMLKGRAKRPSQLQRIGSLIGRRTSSGESNPPKGDRDRAGSMLNSISGILKRRPSREGPDDKDLGTEDEAAARMGSGGTEDEEEQQFGELKGLRKNSAFSTHIENQLKLEQFEKSTIASELGEAPNPDQDMTVKLELTFDSYEFATEVIAVKVDSGSGVVGETFQILNATQSSGPILAIQLKIVWPNGKENTLGIAIVNLSDVLHGLRKAFLEEVVPLMDRDGKSIAAQLKVGTTVLPEIYYERSKLGENMMVEAAKYGHAHVIESMCKYGADVNIVDIDGNSALIAAAKFGFDDIIEILLKHRADIFVENKYGQNAILLAEKNGHKRCAQILVSHVRVLQDLPISMKAWMVRDEKLIEEDKLAFLRDLYRGAYADSELVLHVVKARHLPVADRVGTSDPFVKINLNSLTYQTKVIKRKLDPEWEEHYTFKDQSLGVWESQAIEFEVYDYDMVSKPDLMGTVTVNIQDLFEKQPETKDQQLGRGWFKLRNEEGGVVRGNHEQDKLKKAILQDSELFLRWRFTPAVGRFLNVGVLAVRNLPRLNGKSRPNPFIRVVGGGNEFQTEPVRRDLKAEFNQWYRFKAKNLDMQILIDICELMVKPGKDNRIAGLRVSIRKAISLVQADIPEAWFECYDRDDQKVKGSDGEPTVIRLKFEYIVAGAKDPDNRSENRSVVQKITEGYTKYHDKPKLSDEVAFATKQLIEQSDPEGQVKALYEDVMQETGGVFTTHVIADCSRQLGLDLDHVVTRFAEHAPMGQCPLEFHEFVEVLGLTKVFEQYQEEKELERIEKASAEPTVDIIIQRDVAAQIGMRVVLSQEALEEYPDMIDDSDDGPGTIVMIHPGDNEADEGVMLPGEQCQVIWDKTKRKLDYRTGYEGVFRLALHDESEKQAKDGEEKVINKDITPYIGQRVILRKIATLLFPELDEMAKGKPGTILKVEQTKSDDSDLAGNKCVVLWDATGLKDTFKTGHEGEYRLALYEPPSKITLEDIMEIRGNHSINYLRELILDDNLILSSGGTALAKALRRNHTLQILSIQRNRMEALGGTAIGESLMENNTLTHLYLASNMIGDEGVREIGNTLRDHPGTRLKLLDVEENGIGIRGSRFLARGIRKNRTLTSLNLKNNLVGTDGAAALEHGIRFSITLQFLNLERNVLGDGGVKCIARALRRMPAAFGKTQLAANKSLTELNLCQNNLTDNCIDFILESLFKNRTVHSINLEHNHISDEAQQTLLNALDSNLQQAKLEKAVTSIQKMYRGRRHRRQKIAALKVTEELREEAIIVQEVLDHVPGDESSMEMKVSGEMSATEESVTAVPSVASPKSTHMLEDNELLVAATKVAMYNMGEALLKEQKAAEVVSREAAEKLEAAAQDYEEKQSRLNAVLSDEGADEVDVAAALRELNQAQEAAFMAMEDSQVADDMVAKSFEALAKYEAGEKDEKDITEQLGLSRQVSGELHQPVEEEEEVIQTPKEEREAAVQALDAAVKGADASSLYADLAESFANTETDTSELQGKIESFNKVHDEAVQGLDNMLEAMTDEIASLSKLVEEAEAQKAAEGLHEETKQAVAEKDHVMSAYIRLQLIIADDDADEDEVRKAYADFEEAERQAAVAVETAEVKIAQTEDRQRHAAVDPEERYHNTGSPWHRTGRLLPTLTENPSREQSFIGSTMPSAEVTPRSPDRSDLISWSRDDMISLSEDQQDQQMKDANQSGLKRSGGPMRREDLEAEVI